MISAVESKDIFGDEGDSHQEIKKIDLGGFYNHPSRNQSRSDAIGKEFSSEIVNYETRQVQTAQQK